jgi:hypothetical protein
MEERKQPANYIRQPYPITAFQADLSIRQIRMLAAMMNKVQEKVHEMFKSGAIEGQLTLFPDMQDDHVDITFDFKEVADRPDAYPDVERAAKKFMKIVFSYEDKQRGEITLSHFVDEITFPSHTGKREHICFSFTKKQARTVFNFTMYSRYLLSVVMNAKSKHTARLYMLISSGRGFEKDNDGCYHWHVGYVEIRRILGCDVKDAKGLWCRKSQAQYKHFKSNILQVAQRELKTLADEGMSDCWFDYIEVPSPYDKEPKRLDFVVHMADSEDRKLPVSEKEKLEW